MATKMFKLPDRTSIFIADAMATLEALKDESIVETARVILISVSKSLLKSNFKIRKMHSIILSIKNTVAVLLALGIDINLFWINPNEIVGNWQRVPF